MATELKQQISDVQKDELNQFFNECVSFLPRLLDRGDYESCSISKV